MAKTQFGPGVIVTSKFLNGAQQIYFDGLNEDWHYPPISIDDIQQGGSLGLDGRYVTIATDQTYGNTPVTGNKSFMGLIAYGDVVTSVPANAPKSFSTNAKFNIGGSTQAYADRFANLSSEDIITKEVLNELVFDRQRFRFPEHRRRFLLICLATLLYLILI